MMKYGANNLIPVCGEYTPVERRLNNVKIAGWLNSGKTGEGPFEWDETYNDHIDGTINGLSTQANPYYREEENTSIVVTENQDSALEKCEINGVSVLSNDYHLTEGLSSLQADYYIRDGVSSQVVTVQGKNLFDKTKASLDYYLQANGVVSQSTGWFTSPFIQVGSGLSYVLSSNIGDGIAHFSYYDSAKVLISSVQNNGTANRVYTTPANTAYIRFCSHPISTQIDIQQFELGSSATSYATFVPNSPSPDYPSKIWNTKNIFDKSQIQINKRLTVTGAEEAFSDAPFVAISDYIDITSLQSYTKSVLYSSYLDRRVYYDINKSLLSVTTNYTKTEVVPVNAKFVRFNLLVSDADGFQFELGSTTTAYEPILKAGNYKLTDGADIFEFALPEDIRGISTVQDRVVFNRLEHVGWLDKKCAQKVFDGNEVTWSSDAANANGYIRFVAVALVDNKVLTACMCSHFKHVASISADNVSSPPAISTTVYTNYVYIGFPVSLLNGVTYNLTTSQGRSDAFNAWLLANPITITYVLATPTRTTITFTKVASSTLPEFPATALTVTQSPDYPYTIAPYVKAGTYKITTNNGIYETTLADDMQGVGDYADKIVFNKLTGKGWRETRIKKVQIPNTTAFSDWNESIRRVQLSNTDRKAGYYSLGLCNVASVLQTSIGNNKLNQMGVYSLNAVTYWYPNWEMFGLTEANTSSEATAALRAWLTVNAAIYTYVLATLVRTEQTFTKVASSSAPELPSSALTMGRNKFNKDTVTLNKFVAHATGIETVSGTSNNASALISVSESQITISGQTYVQGDPSSVGLAWYTSAQAFISGSAFTNVTGNGTYTRPANASYVRYTVNAVDLATSQLEAGGVANSYESFFVKDVPNPNYPVSISNVDEPILRACNKNWLKQTEHILGSSETIIGVTVTYNSDGTCTLNGTSTASLQISLCWDNFKLPEGNYRISSTVDGIQLGAQLGGTANIYIMLNPTNYTSANFTVSKSDAWFNKYRVYFHDFTVGRVYNNVTIYPMIVSGSTQTAWTPYSGITLPYTTSPLYSLSSSIFDKLNVLRGKEIHNIGVKVFDGTETWTEYNNTYSTNGVHVYFITLPLFAIGRYTSVCTHFINAQDKWDANRSNGVYSDHSTIANKYFGTLYSTVALWKAYLASEYAKGTPVTVIYQLATPTEVAQTPQVVPLYSLTNIFVDKETTVQIGYKLKDSTVKVGTDIIAPHPDYQSLILSSGGNVKTRSRNYWDKDSAVLGDVNITTGADISSTTRYRTGFIKSSSLANYRFNKDDGKMPCYRSDYSYIGLSSYVNSLWTTLAGTVYIKIVAMSNNDIQVESGTIINSYLPYHTPTSIVLPTLRSIKLAPTAVDQNYTDALGNKYCADTLTYKGSGVYELVQRTGRYIITGSENWIKHTVSVSGGAVYYYGLLKGSRIVSCSHYKFIDWDYAATLVGYSISVDSGFGNIWLKHIGITEVTAFKAFLASEYARGTPVTVDYILATPIVTQLTLGELKTFPYFTALEQDGTTKAYMNINAKVIDRTL